MTVVMTTSHDGEHFDMEIVHEAKIPSTEHTVGFTHCGLMFDVPEFITRAMTVVVRDVNVQRMAGRLVTALEVDVAPTCLRCIARNLYEG